MPSTWITCQPYCVCTGVCETWFGFIEKAAAENAGSMSPFLNQPRSPPLSDALALSVETFLASVAKSAPWSSWAMTSLACFSVGTRMWRACTSSWPLWLAYFAW